MTDPTEAALRAIEAKYYPEVMDGKSLMPFYPREDVSVMIAAAVAEEREACASMLDAKAASLDEWAAKVGTGMSAFTYQVRAQDARDAAADIRSRKDD